MTAGMEGMKTKHHRHPCIVKKLVVGLAWTDVPLGKAARAGSRRRRSLPMKKKERDRQEIKQRDHL
jgi:hypothetical protein